MTKPRKVIGVSRVLLLAFGLVGSWTGVHGIIIWCPGYVAALVVACATTVVTSAAAAGAVCTGKDQRAFFVGSLVPLALIELITAILAAYFLIGLIEHSSTSHIAWNRLRIQMNFDAYCVLAAASWGAAALGGLSGVAVSRVARP